jgi:hypothetical protein
MKKKELPQLKKILKIEEHYKRKCVAQKKNRSTNIKK